MVEINGIPPPLEGNCCEELWCQQYWHQGRLEEEGDVVFLKVQGAWYQLYIDNGIVFWRSQEEAPTPSGSSQDKEFDFPIVDLGTEFAVKGSLITECVAQGTESGVKVRLVFADHGTVEVVNEAGATSIRHLS